MSRERDNGRVGLRAFFEIAKLWELNDIEMLRLLGQTDHDVVDAWANEEGPDVSKDTLERISYILGIFKAINILLPIPERANVWMRKPNKAPIFGGHSALKRMTAGNVSDLYVVRKYLDAELNG
ncbi:MbcA/ParS/Xre antitoxin family protein [Qipengyuania sp.]|uniref:MbcA/ParS/Xre antitoxin family protein n=1 Tax=Qipengyuania sp. TaxID=2004515 RepID=UPI003AF754C6